MPSQEELDRLINSYRGSQGPPIELLKFLEGPGCTQDPVSSRADLDTLPDQIVAFSDPEGPKFESTSEPAELYVQLPLFMEEKMIEPIKELTVPEPSAEQLTAQAMIEKAQREIDEAILRGELPKRRISLKPVIIRESHQDRLDRRHAEQQAKKDQKAAKQAKASRKANRHKKS